MNEGNQKYLNTFGVYVHVPFCSSTCDFCAFYQERPSKKKFETYFLSLEREMQRANINKKVDTVFIGGGTPGILRSDELMKLCELINGLGIKENAEWTVELAPNEVTTEKLTVLKSAGVNRISLGVQTFDPKLMDDLGRKHGPEKVFHAYNLIRETKFNSVNLDLIFGIPHQSLEDWMSDMEQAVKLQPQHLSTYCLTFEEDTALYHRLAKEELKIDIQREASFYEYAWDFLPSSGYEQYEVSNFALDGHTCVHNQNTWKMNEWIGFGPSASSQYQFKRWKNPSDLDRWAIGVRDGFKTQDYEDYVELSNVILAEDAILFGLRMNQGIRLAQIGKRFGLSEDFLVEIHCFFDNLQKEGLAVQMDGWISLTSQGRIRADAIATEFPSESKGLS